MSDRHAETSVPLHDLLATRYSTRAFDSEYTVADEEITALLEAARWAPSAGNSQPARFIVGRRDDENFTRILAALNPGNQGWARHASLLVVAVRVTADEKGPMPGSGAYDVGQAMAHLTFQAAADRLTVRQMAGFDRDALAASFGLPETLEPLTVAAVGRADDPKKLPDDLRGPDDAPRVRLPLSELVLG
ncbi:nitroreductase family protein [Phytomonospora sp. NPDC050363]|uniref:nitroreductase family protein n=1 Tax=Phytomonospora sp. NPDC050363 TaxID=3155642 RepID=UPI0033C700B3